MHYIKLGVLYIYISFSYSVFNKLVELSNQP